MGLSVGNIDDEVEVLSPLLLFDGDSPKIESNSEEVVLGMDIGESLLVLGSPGSPSTSIEIPESMAFQYGRVSFMFLNLKSKFIIVLLFFDVLLS
mmetsp:Transcript_9790/g.20493  ORF Transcript_9790/g.20493 Transcript_9790/m.20493 type:complete len:95 (+) Transcript_9790:1612-1896(+)